MSVLLNANDNFVRKNIFFNSKLFMLAYIQTSHLETCCAKCGVNDAKGFVLACLVATVIA